MANVTKTSVVTLLGPAGASVTKGSVATLLGPRGASVTKVTVMTLLGSEEAPPPDGAVIFKAKSNRVFTAHADRNSSVTLSGQSNHEFENRFGVASGVEFTASTGSEFDGLGGTEIITHTLTGSTLLTFDSLRLKGVAGQSLLSSVGMQALTLNGTSLLSSNKLEARTVVGYSLLGPAVQTSRSPVKGPPRIEEARLNPPLVATKIVLPAPPERYDPNWARRFAEQVTEELSKLQKVEEANHGMLLRSDDGKVYELRVVDGEMKLSYRQG